MNQTLDTTDLTALLTYGSVGYAIQGELLTTAQLDTEAEDIWPEGTRYYHAHRNERTPLIIRYWKKVQDNTYELDREPDHVLLMIDALLDSFGPTGIQTYLLRRLNFEYTNPYSVTWRCDDPTMAYRAIADPQFATLHAAAEYIIQEMKTGSWLEPEDVAALTTENIIEQMGIRTKSATLQKDDKYPGGKYYILHQKFHLEVEYPENPEMLYTVEWVSDCKESRYTVETKPVFNSISQAIHYIHREVMKNGQFANPVGYNRGMVFDRTAYGRIAIEREVVLKSVFDGSIIGKYVLKDLDPKEVIGSWAYEMEATNQS